jgi:DNA adenine methylase
MVENKPQETSATSPKPFVKWAGGKRQLLSDIKLRLPQSFNKYFEPFLGGAAVFFELTPSRAALSDVNSQLITTYKAIQDNVATLVEALKEHASQHSKEYYYKTRSRHSLTSDLEIAARFIYLNKTCFNGLYRVNKKGEFNVPIGSYKNPTIVQEDNLWACHYALKNASIDYKEFDTINPQSKDFVYFDPPYDMINDASFTSYTMLGFSRDDQTRLKEFCDSLHSKGVFFMLSNSNTDFIRNLYEGYNLDVVMASRFVNSKGNSRKNKVEEVLITNY